MINESGKQTDIKKCIACQNYTETRFIAIAKRFVIGILPHK